MSAVPDIRADRPFLGDVYAVIVAYNPIAAQLTSLVKSLVGQCGGILVMDNGGASAVQAAESGWPESAECVPMSDNLGLGTALNRGFAMARERGARYVITFDQDSAPGAGTVEGLLNAFDHLSAKGLQVAAVGPRFIDDRYGRRGEFPFMRLAGGWPREFRCSGESELIKTDFLITSGCLMSITAYDAVGEFDPGMFVDYTDIEWGFRANSLGFVLFGVCSVVMRHELGQGQAATVLGLTILGYSPLRRYYYARNTIRLLTLPYVAWPWKARMLLGLVGRLALLPAAGGSRPSLRREWAMYLKGIFAGVRGIRGRMTEYDEPRHTC